MLYTICAIVRRRLEQEKNAECRETILEMLDLLESPENLTKAPEQTACFTREFSLRSVESEPTASSAFILSQGSS